MVASMDGPLGGRRTNRRESTLYPTRMDMGSRAVSRHRRHLLSRHIQNMLFKKIIQQFFPNQIMSTEKSIDPFNVFKEDRELTRSIYLHRIPVGPLVLLAVQKSRQKGSVVFVGVPVASVAYAVPAVATLALGTGVLKRQGTRKAARWARRT